MEKKYSDDRPVGALQTIADARSTLEQGRPIYLILPSHCSSPRFERHDSIESLRVYHNGSNIGGWSVNDDPLTVPFSSRNGYIFANYWFAYAFHLRGEKG